MRPGTIYLDETKPNIGRYAAVSAVSIDDSATDEIQARTRAALGDLKELKFSGMSDGRQERAALQIIHLVMEFADKGQLRVDTLSWDKIDKRNGIKGRDDYANIGRMLHHLLLNAIRKWDAPYAWTMIPDEQEQIDYKTIARTVNASLTNRAKSDSLIVSIESSDSKSVPAVQIADLFAGIAGYMSGLTDDIMKTASRSTRARNRAITMMLPWLQAHGGILFRKGEGLATARSCAVNFWPYRPQGDYDRAPTKDEPPAVPLLVKCRRDDCDVIFLNDYGLANPLCPQHYGDLRLEREEDELRYREEQKRLGGSHYCAKCATLLFVDDSMKHVNMRTYEEEYRCRDCGAVLTEIDPAPQPRSDPHEEPLRKSEPPKRPSVRLPKQDYRSDD